MQSSKEQQREIRKSFSAITARNRGKQQNGKDQRSLQEDQRYQGNISCKDRLDKGQKWYEAEDIKKRWQECTEERYKTELQDPDNHSGVITHLEPDILECEVKWALGRMTMNKASGSDGIPAEVLKNIKDDAVKVLHSTRQQIQKTQLWPQDWKRSVFIPISKRGNVKFKLPYTIHISHASKIMLKILQARLQQYM